MVELQEVCFNIEIKKLKIITMNQSGNSETLYYEKRIVNIGKRE